MPLKLPSFRARRDVYPPDLWTKCPACSTMLFNKQLEKNLRVCTTCGHHFRLSAGARLEHLLDPGSWAERDPGLQSVDALGFVDQKPYPDRLSAAQLATGMRDAAVWGTGAIGGTQLAVCVMDFGFMGGSMGAVVGEKVTRAAEHALAARVPLLIVSASGGARMQEGTLALMQLAKTLAALERLRAAGVPFVSILSDPTTGGVFASFAAVGDVNIAEPNALIGFAGARVTAGTIAAELPEGFQRAEFLYSHGFVDRVVARPELRGELTQPAAPAARARRRPPRRWTRPTTSPRSGRCRSCPRSRTGWASWRTAMAAAADRLARPMGASPVPNTVPMPAPDGSATDGAPAERGHDRRGLGARPAGAQPAPSADPRVHRRDGRRLRRAARRPAVRRRRGHGRGPGQDRRTPGRRHRPAEGRRHGREHPAQLRDAASRGLPQGHAGHGARRTPRPAGRHVRRRPGRPSRARNPRSAASPRRSPARSG